MKRIWSLILAFITLTSVVNGQSTKDSLKLVLDGYLEDKDRMNALIDLTSIYMGVNPDSCETYARLALNMAKRLGNEETEARATYAIGRSYDERGQLDSSLHYFLLALDLFETLNDSVWIVGAYSAIGNSYYYKGIHNTALKNHDQALKLAEKWNLDSEAANAHNNLAIVYSEQKFYDKALEHYKAAKRQFLKEGNSYTLGATELNIGNMYAATNRPDSAIYYFLKADSLFQPIGQLYALALNWTNLGEAYHRKGQLRISQEYLDKAIKAQKDLKDEFGLAYSYARLADVLIDINELDSAEEILLKADTIGDKIGALRINEMTSEGLHKLYSKQGNWKSALRFKERQIIYRDSIQNQATSRIISNLESEYENEKKENEIIKLRSEQELSAAELRKRNIQLATSIVIALLLLILVLVVVYFMTALRSANSTLNEQKQVIERINQHMTDGIRSAERLQKGAFPNPFDYMPDPERCLLLYRPKDIVSGDFYWSHKLDDTKTLIAVADCTGHGVSGALLSMLAFLSLERSVKEFGLSLPNHIIHKTNELMKSVFSHETHDNTKSPVRDGMDISLCLVDKTTNVVTYSGAKGMAAILKSGEKEVIPLKGSRFSIGDDSEISADQIESHQTSLNPGDKVLMYTDGIIDQFGGPNDRKFSHKRLRSIFASHLTASITRLGDDLNRQLDDWQGKSSQTDDITVLGFEI